MPRWIQRVREDGTTYMEPRDEAAKRHDGVAIHGDIQSFVSPIDGTVISDRRQYDEHCKRHNVVPAQEFSPEFYERKAKERARFYSETDGRTRQQVQRDREQIHEIIVRQERNGQ